MAKILDTETCKQIRALQKEFEPYAEQGWMCEGTEYESGDRYLPGNIIFNNDLDASFVADYNGKIISSVNCHNASMEDMAAMAQIQGNIAKLAHGSYSSSRER